MGRNGMGASWSLLHVTAVHKMGYGRIVLWGLTCLLLSMRQAMAERSMGVHLRITVHDRSWCQWTHFICTVVPRYVTVLLRHYYLLHS
jgi:hypothetical protein